MLPRLALATLLLALAPAACAPAAPEAPLAVAVSGGAFGDIERPLVGGCSPAIVGALLRKDPTLTLGAPHSARFARWLARFTRCDEVLALVDAR